MRVANPPVRDEYHRLELQLVPIDNYSVQIQPERFSRQHLSKSDEERLRCGDLIIFAITAVHSLKISKVSILFTPSVSACDSASVLQISHKLDSKAQRYGQKTNLKMTSVCHLGFVKF